MRRSPAELDRHLRQTIDGALDAFIRAAPDDVAARALSAPFAVLYLRWEAHFPQEWGAPASCMWSRWTTKEVLLRKLERGGLPEQVKPQLADLVVSALSRPYRCKDWMYGCLVRHVADPSFVDRVDALQGTDDPSLRLRARFVLDIAEHPERKVQRASWERWLCSVSEARPLVSVGGSDVRPPGGSSNMS